MLWKQKILKHFKITYAALAALRIMDLSNRINALPYRLYSEWWLTPAIHDGELERLAYFLLQLLMIQHDKWYIWKMSKHFHRKTAVEKIKGWLLSHLKNKLSMKIKLEYLANCILIWPILRKVFFKPLMLSIDLIKFW